jgi:hypothetical protein
MSGALFSWTTREHANASPTKFSYFFFAEILVFSVYQVIGPNAF